MIGKTEKDADWFANIKLAQLTMTPQETQDFTMQDLSQPVDEIGQIMNQLTKAPMYLGQAIEAYPEHTEEFKEAASDAWYDLVFRNPAMYKQAYGYYQNNPQTLELLNNSALQGLLQ
jgi:hypothetical protein